MVNKEYYGPWALIAGGSEGIGAAFARQLAESGFNLMLVARNPEPLAKLAEDIRATHPACEVRTHSADLSRAEDVAGLIAATSNLEVGLLICNAGAAAHWADFLDADLERNRAVIGVNIDSTLALVHALGRQMRERGRGGILLVTSMASNAGSHGFACYSAAKAFVRNFAEGLWHELRPSGVHVLGYVVGAAATPSLARNFPAVTGRGADPASLAKQGLANLANGPLHYPDGGELRATMLATMPRAEAVKILYEASAAYRS